MLCDYEIYPEKRLIFMRFRGEFTFAQLKSVVETLWRDRRYSRSYDGLIDVTDTKIGVSTPDFYALMEFVLGNKSTSQGRWAAVAASPLVTALSMIYRRLAAERHSFGVFSTFHRAGEFVGVELSEDSLSIPSQLGKR